MHINHLTLIGVGLIGGSFVLDLKRNGQVEQITGIDINRDNLDRALERRVIDIASTEINAQNIGNADLILIATPVSTFPSICTAIAPYLQAHTIISDVGSTKQSTLNAFLDYLPQHFSQCVAAHPIAGSDRSGALAARFGLYQDKKLILCPHSQQNNEALQTIASLWQSVGAQTVQMTAEKHDAIFAAVSHLPHLIAFSYMDHILQAPECQDYLNFAGSGFRDFTRIAASHPQMWSDIALENRDTLIHLLNQQIASLDTLRKLIEQNDKELLYRYIANASKGRTDWEQ